MIGDFSPDSKNTPVISFKGIMHKLASALTLPSLNSPSKPFDFFRFFSDILSTFPEISSPTSGNSLSLVIDTISGGRTDKTRLKKIYSFSSPGYLVNVVIEPEETNESGYPVCQITPQTKV